MAASVSLVKKPFLPSASGPPRHVAHAQFVHILARLCLLEEHVRLHLVHRRDNVHEVAEVDEVIGIEVAHADGSHFPCLQRAFECAIGVVAVAERLV